MSKYKSKPDDPLVVRPVRFEQRAINAVAKIHNNFSEFVRDALDEKILKERAVLDSVDSHRRERG